MTAVDAFLAVIFVLWFIDRVMDLVLRKMMNRQIDLMQERIDTLDKRLSLLLEASELQHTMISSDRDDIERLMKAFNAANN